MKNCNLRLQTIHISTTSNLSSSKTTIYAGEFVNTELTLISTPTIRKCTHEFTVPVFVFVLIFLYFFSSVSSTRLARQSFSGYEQFFFLCGLCFGFQKTHSIAKTLVQKKKKKYWSFPAAWPTPSHLILNSSLSSPLFSSRLTHFLCFQESSFSPPSFSSYSTLCLFLLPTKVFSYKYDFFFHH